MHIRVDELLEERGWSPYQLAQEAEKHGVSVQAIYRLVRAHGRMKRLDMRVLAVLCHVFGVGVDEVLSRGP